MCRVAHRYAMAQINPYSGYLAEPALLDRRPIGDRKSGQPRREPQKEKPPEQPEDQVELHGEADELPVPEPKISEVGDEGGHLDVCA
jgi:hypothetical protein